jgi:hypothetical protein
MADKKGACSVGWGCSGSLPACSCLWMRLSLIIRSRSRVTELAL